MLEEIAERSSPRRLVIALVPSEIQVDAALRERVLAAEGLGEREIDVEKPGRVLRAHFEERGGSRAVVVVDLLPALRDAGAEAYHPRDSHWNDRGNALVAAALSRELAPLIRGID